MNSPAKKIAVAACAVFLALPAWSGDVGALQTLKNAAAAYGISDEAASSAPKPVFATASYRVWRVSQTHGIWSPLSRAPGLSNRIQARASGLPSPQTKRGECAFNSQLSHGTVCEGRGTSGHKHIFIDLGSQHGHPLCNKRPSFVHECFGQRHPVYDANARSELGNVGCVDISRDMTDWQSSVGRVGRR